MAAQKQSLPSFASIISVLSIVLYCAGFLRVELELNEQKTRITALEKGEEAKQAFTESKHPEPTKFVENAPGKSNV